MDDGDIAESRGPERVSRLRLDLGFRRESYVAEAVAALEFMHIEAVIYIVRATHILDDIQALADGYDLGIGRGISPHEYASLGYPMEESHKYFYDVINAIRAADGTERFEFRGDVYDIPPTSIRPQARHKGELTKNIKVAFSTEASAKLAAENGLGQMFVAGDDVNEMIDKVQRFNRIRKDLGLPPDQPTTLLWMYCAETTAEAEEGWVYFKNQGIAAQHHYFDWNNPGYEGIRGYEEYLLRQNADISPAEARLAARRATQPIGTPEAIIEKIKTLQQTISMEKVVIHMMYGGMPRDKAEKSLRLFAEKVLPEVQAMSTPINPKSLG
mgnify:CR=1 FL=1